MNQHLTVIESDSVVVSMKRASTALAEAVTISQTKKIMDVAAAAEIYAKRQHLSEEAEQMAATVKVEALRKLGEMLQAAPKATAHLAPSVGSQRVPTRNSAPTLSELGLTKKESAVAQKLAALPEKSFQQVRDGHVTVAKAIAAVDSAKQTATNRRQAPQDGAANVDRREQDPQPYRVDNDGAPSLEELLEAEQVIAAEQDAILQILAADDKLRQALAMLKQRDALIEQLKWRINGLVNENGELVRDVKYWRNQARKAAA